MQAAAVRSCQKHSARGASPDLLHFWLLKGTVSHNLSFTRIASRSVLLYLYNGGSIFRSLRYFTYSIISRHLAHCQSPLCYGRQIRLSRNYNFEVLSNLLLAFHACIPSLEVACQQCVRSARTKNKLICIYPSLEPLSAFLFSAGAFWTGRVPNLSFCIDPRQNEQANNKPLCRISYSFLMHALAFKTILVAHERRRGLPSAIEI
jgi:hypothetical protein